MQASTYDPYLTTLPLGWPPLNDSCLIKSVAKEKPNGKNQSEGENSTTFFKNVELVLDVHKATLLKP